MGPNYFVAFFSEEDAIVASVEIPKSRYTITAEFATPNTFTVIQE